MPIKSLLKNSALTKTPHNLTTAQIKPSSVQSRKVPKGQTEKGHRSIPTLRSTQPGGGNNVTKSTIARR